MNDWPGRREALGLRVALGLVGFIGVVAGIYGGAPFYVWAATRNAPHPSDFPYPFLVAPLLPGATIALGVWAYRGKRVYRGAAILTIVMGILGLVAFAGLILVGWALSSVA